MPGWTEVVLAVLVGMVALWGLLVLALWLEQRRHGDVVSLRELLRLAPDVVRLLGRLVRDRTVDVRTRIWLGALLLYLLSPIDLVPDFIPVLGYLDDALVVVIALRAATRAAGSDAIGRHWPGTPAGLAALLRLAGVEPGPSR